MARKVNKKQRFNGKVEKLSEVELCLSIFGLECAKNIQNELHESGAPKKWICSVSFMNSQTGDTVQLWGK